MEIQEKGQIQELKSRGKLSPIFQQPLGRGCFTALQNNWGNGLIMMNEFMSVKQLKQYLACGKLWINASYCYHQLSTGCVPGTESPKINESPCRAQGLMREQRSEWLLSGSLAVEARRVVVNSTCQLGRTTVLRYSVKYCSGCFCEALFRWDGHLSQWTLSKADGPPNGGGPYPISWKPK